MRTQCTNCEIIVIEVSIYVPGCRCHICGIGVMLVSLSQTEHEKRLHRESHQALETAMGDSLFSRLIAFCINALMTPPKAYRNREVYHYDP